MQKIKAASEHFIETEKKKREKAYQGEPETSTNTQLTVRKKILKLQSLAKTCTLKGFTSFFKKKQSFIFS